MASLPEHLSARPVGRQRLSREVMEEHRRDRVVDATIEIFAKRGYQGTTIEHIITGAKVGVGSFYSLLEGKEDCFLRAYARIAGEAFEQVASALPAGVPWPEQVAAALRSLLALIAAEPLRARIVLVEVQTAGPTALARYQETLDRLIALLRHGRQLSPQAAELPLTLEEASVSGLAWLLHRQLVMGEGVRVEGLFGDLLGILLEPYLGTAEVKRLIAAGAPAPASA